MQIIRDLVTRAGEKDVVLAVENTGRPDYLDFVLSGIDSPGIGLCYDSSHDFLFGMTRGTILAKWRDRLVTTHLSDNNGEYDDHALPWDGKVDWEIVADCFPSETYSGPIMLEVYPQNGDRRTPEEFLTAAYERAVRLREKLG
jgi:sugar phosphate isomerase/epimerase